MTNHKNAIGISEIMRALAMKRSSVIKQIENGNIHAQKKGNRYVFESAEADRLQALHGAYIGCFDLAKSLSCDNTSFDVAHKKCIEHFYGFLETNSFFGCEIMRAEDVFFTEVKNERYYLKCSDADKIKADLKLWINTYGLDPNTKILMLINRMKEKYSGTAGIIKRFCDNEAMVNSNAMLNLIDYLYGNLTKELKSMNEYEMDGLADDIGHSLSRESAVLFSRLISFARGKRLIRNGWVYDFKARENNRNNDAYSIHEFMLQAYVVFNREAWINECMVKKAIMCKRYADMWLFVAMHFVCGWRKSDILRLPKVADISNDIVSFENIYNGADFSDIVTALEQRLMYVPISPSKTMSTANIPYLKLSIPSSLISPFGVILAISLSHHNEVDIGMPFIEAVWDYREFKAFFGQEFMDACRNKRFSTRRANKAYLQGIETVSSDSENKHIGYMLAAVARSHKGGYGALPKTTDIYLRDAAFSGCDVQFIAKEMFERGIFSFIPAVLLRMCSRDFSKLPVASQTKAIKEVGLLPAAIENVSGCFVKGLERAKNTVSELLSDTEHIQEKAYMILKNIAEHKSPAKQDDLLCLMTAAGQPCPYVFRSSCIGCGYEIYTVGIISTLMNEYKRLSKLQNNAVADDTERYNKIITRAVLPAVAEILSAAISLYPDQDMSFLKAIVKRGLDDA